MMNTNTRTVIGSVTFFWNPFAPLMGVKDRLVSSSLSDRFKDLIHILMGVDISLPHHIFSMGLFDYFFPVFALCVMFRAKTEELIENKIVVTILNLIPLLITVLGEMIKFLPALVCSVFLSPLVFFVHLRVKPKKDRLTKAVLELDVIIQEDKKEDKKEHRQVKLTMLMRELKRERLAILFKDKQNTENKFMTPEGPVESSEQLQAKNLQLLLVKKKINRVSLEQWQEKVGVIKINESNILALDAMTQLERCNNLNNSDKETQILKGICQKRRFYWHNTTSSLSHSSIGGISVFWIRMIDF